MPTVYLLDPVAIRHSDTNLAPAAGAKLHTWIAGTTTDQAAYTDSTGTTPLSNPVVADSAGIFPEMWVTANAYDLECRKADDTTVLWNREDVKAPVAQLTAAFAAPGGAGLIEHVWTEDNYEDSTVGEHIQDAQTAVNVMRAIPKAQRAAIRGYTSTFDATTLLQSILSSHNAYVPEGGFRTSSALSVVRGLHGSGWNSSQILPLANNFDAVTVPAGTRGLKLEDVRVIFPSLGTGKAFVLTSNVANCVLDNLEANHAAVGFYAPDTAFQLDFRNLRADDCTTGYSVGGTGTGTSLVFYKCYCSNGPGGSALGWNLDTHETVSMTMPTMDMGGYASGVNCRGVGHLTVTGGHFEGTPSGNGAVFTYATLGSLSQGMALTGVRLVGADLSALTYQFLNVQANDDDVKITLTNCSCRNVTGGTNAKLAKISGAAGSKVTLIAINCDFGALEDQFDTSAMSGTFVYRKIRDQAYACLARGVTSVAGSGTIHTGIVGLDTKFVTLQIRYDDLTNVAVMANIMETYSGTDEVKVGFRNLTDGSVNTGTFPVQWMVFE